MTQKVKESLAPAADHVQVGAPVHDGVVLYTGGKADGLCGASRNCAPAADHVQVGACLLRGIARNRSASVLGTPVGMMP
jgi:hypothetical protein